MYNIMWFWSWLYLCLQLSDFHLCIFHFLMLKINDVKLLNSMKIWNGVFKVRASLSFFSTG